VAVRQLASRASRRVREPPSPWPPISRASVRSSTPPSRPAREGDFGALIGALELDRELGRDVGVCASIVVPGCESCCSSMSQAVADEDGA
jgi:hypothetical protein